MARATTQLTLFVTIVCIQGKIIAIDLFHQRELARAATTHMFVLSTKTKKDLSAPLCRSSTAQYCIGGRHILWYCVIGCAHKKQSNQYNRDQDLHKRRAGKYMCHQGTQTMRMAQLNPTNSSPHDCLGHVAGNGFAITFPPECAYVRLLISKVARPPIRTGLGIWKYEMKRPQWRRLPWPLPKEFVLIPAHRIIAMKTRTSTASTREVTPFLCATQMNPAFFSLCRLSAYRGVPAARQHRLVRLASGSEKVACSHFNFVLLFASYSRIQ